MTNNENGLVPGTPLLAQAYVPVQNWTGELFDLQIGLREGTIFPELVQPMCWYEWEEYE